MSIAELPNEPFRSSKVPLVDAIKMWQLSTANGKHFKDLKVEDIFHHSWHFYKDFYFSDQSGRVYCSPPSIYCGQINGQWCRRRRHLRKRLKIKVFHMGSDCVRLRERDALIDFFISRLRKLTKQEILQEKWITQISQILIVALYLSPIPFLISPNFLEHATGTGRQSIGIYLRHSFFSQILLELNL